MAALGNAVFSVGSFAGTDGAVEPDVVEVVADEFEHFQIESALERNAVGVHFQRCIAGDGAGILEEGLKIYDM